MSSDSRITLVEKNLAWMGNVFHAIASAWHSGPSTQILAHCLNLQMARHVGRRRYGIVLEPLDRKSVCRDGKGESLIALALTRVPI